MTAIIGLTTGITTAVGSVRTTGSGTTTGSRGNSSTGRIGTHRGPVAIGTAFRPSGDWCTTITSVRSIGNTLATGACISASTDAGCPCSCVLATRELFLYGECGSLKGGDTVSELPTVYIEREPLLSMVFAAVELFNRECLGYLFGYSSGKPTNYFIITNAVQLAAVVRRTRCGVHQSKRACKRIGGLIEKAPKLFPYLADFHSHPHPKMWRGSSGLSEEDRKSMTDAEEFCIIIALSPRGERLLEWTMRDDGTRLRGSLGRFDVHFTAHRVVRDDEKKPVKDEQGIQQTERLPLQVAKATLNALNRAAKSKKS